MQQGGGRNNVIAALLVKRGITAAELKGRVSSMLSVPTSEINLMNLDSPMYLVGGVCLVTDTRVGVAARVRGG